jgi:hypothetical protein
MLDYLNSNLSAYNTRRLIVTLDEDVLWVTHSYSGDVVVVIVRQLDLKLAMQSVPITTNVVSSNPAQVRCSRYNIMW